MRARETLSAVEAVRRKLSVDADILLGGEAVHAGVVGVVHEVLDRVSAGLVGARVTADRAAVGGRALLCGLNRQNDPDLSGH